MILEEISKIADVHMNYFYEDIEFGTGWYWTVDCGYQSWQSSKSSPDPVSCLKELKEWLSTFNGPTK